MALRKLQPNAPTDAYEKRVVPSWARARQAVTAAQIADTRDASIRDADDEELFTRYPSLQDR